MLQSCCVSTLSELTLQNISKRGVSNDSFLSELIQFFVAPNAHLAIIVLWCPQCCLSWQLARFWNTAKWCVRECCSNSSVCMLVRCHLSFLLLEFKEHRMSALLVFDLRHAECRRKTSFRHGFIFCFFSLHWIHLLHRSFVRFCLSRWFLHFSLFLRNTLWSCCLVRIHFLLLHVCVIHYFRSNWKFLLPRGLVLCLASLAERQAADLFLLLLIKLAVDNQLQKVYSGDWSKHEFCNNNKIFKVFNSFNFNWTNFTSNYKEMANDTLK